MTELPLWDTSEEGMLMKSVTILRTTRASYWDLMDIRVERQNGMVEQYDEICVVMGMPFELH